MEVIAKVHLERLINSLCCLRSVSTARKCVCEVLLRIPGVHQYVIQVYKYKTVDVSPKNIIHEPLEGGWCVAQPEG